MSGENKMTLDTWFPCYPSDLISNTTRLCPHDFGAYWRLLCDYYQNGPLPNNDDDLRHITGVDPQDWARTKGKVMEFFQLNGDGKWHQKRADEIIAERERISAATIENSRKGVEARRKLGQLPPNPKDEPPVEPLVNQGIDQSRTHPHPQPHLQVQPQVQPQSKGAARADLIRAEKEKDYSAQELKRVEDEIGIIRNSATVNAMGQRMLTKTMADRLNVLKARQSTLKKQIGFVA